MGAATSAATAAGRAAVVEKLEAETIPPHLRTGEVCVNRAKRQQLKARLRKQRIRHEKYERKFGPEFTPPSPFLMETVLADLQQAMKEREFSSTEEMNRFLNERLRKQSRPEADPKRQAQQLAFRAMESHDPLEMMELADVALNLDSHCIDALKVMAVMAAAGSVEALVSRMQDVVHLAERDLGPDFFRDHRGHFWSMIETRPYMRARSDLTAALIRAGRREEAIEHLEDMLDLNPNDNQGLREPLLSCCLLTGDLDRVRGILREYREDGSAMFCWTRVLERFLAGDLDQARVALDDARAENPSVESYLCGHKKLPSLWPDYYSPGDQSEAVHCAKYLKGWNKYPEAMQWVRSNRPARRGPPVKPAHLYASAPLRIGRQKNKGLAALGTYSAEISMVDREYPVNPKPLRCGDHRGIYET